MQALESVGGVVDKYDAEQRIENQSEQRSGPRRRTRVSERHVCNLGPLRSDLRNETISAIDGEDVPAISDGKAQWTVQASPEVSVRPVPSEPWRDMGRKITATRLLNVSAMYNTGS